MNIRILLLTTVAAIVLTSTSCSTITKKESTPVKLHLQTPLLSLDKQSYDAYIANLKETADNFHKLNPHITVFVDPVTTMDQSSQKLASEEPQDIVSLFVDPYELSQKEPYLLDLKRQASEALKGDIHNRILDLVTIKNKLLALPYAADPLVVIYNKTFFDKAKLPYPKGDWTWEQFRDISRSTNPNQAPLLPYNIATLGILMGSYGKYFLSTDGETAVGYLDSPEAIRSLKWLNAYYKDAEKPIVWNDDNISMQFASTQTSMFVYFSSLKLANLKDNIGYAPLPHFAGSERANQVRFYGLGVAQKSKHPAEAWKFIEYLTLTNHETMSKWADYHLMTSKSISEATGQTTDPIKSIAIEELKHAVRAAGDNSHNPYFYRAWNEALTAEFKKLLTTDDKDIPTGLHSLAINIDQEMNRLKHVNEQQKRSPTP